MRLMLGRLVWKFDLLPADEKTKNWYADCAPYHLWYKPPLKIRLVAVDGKE